MNEKIARDIRVLVYGAEYSPRARKYKRHPNGQITSDSKRMQYQHCKKNIKEAKV